MEIVTVENKWTFKSHRGGSARSLMMGSEFYHTIYSWLVDNIGSGNFKFLHTNQESNFLENGTDFLFGIILQSEEDVNFFKLRFSSELTIEKYTVPLFIK